jgi:hypothetical protein
VLAAGATILAILWVLQLVNLFDFIAQSDNPLAAWLKDRLKPSWATAAGLALSAVALFGLGKFLTDYMGDVEAWATYEETDEKHQRRRKVIGAGIDTFKHVLALPDCERVVVVSHSLGTTVAHDTLLALARGNRAYNSGDPISGPVDLRKLSHFVTIASPIDKIEYMFESYASQYHRYKRVVESLRGDVGSEPFLKNRHPYVHWVNFWDRGDIISGSLHSPANAESLANRVDNIHVSNLHFPDPGASHSAYFQNRKVVRPLFEMIYRNAHSFQTLKSVNRKPKDYESVFMGPGDTKDVTKGFFALAFAIPWLALIGVLLVVFGIGGIAAWFFAAAGLAAGLLLISYLTGSARGMRDPL